MAAPVNVAMYESNQADEEKEEAINELASSSAAAARTNTIRQDWYQTDSYVVVSLFLKNLKQEDISMTITTNSISCKLPICSELSACETVHLTLLHPVCPGGSTWKVLPTKVEIKLKKEEVIWWNTLVGTASSSAASRQPTTGVVPVAVSNIARPSPASCVPSYPSSCTQKRDWDRIVHDIQQDEASEKLEGESALNQLFQKIYSEGSDEVKKAMNKSFMESGGTVLSTNWKDVGEKEVHVNPPEGLEFKKWDT